MRKLLMFAVMGFLVCFLSSGVWAYTYNFPNHTYVRVFNSNGDVATTWKAPGETQAYQWHDVISDPISKFQSYGADISLSGSTYTMKLYTNYNGAETYFPYADLFFDARANGKGWDYAINVSEVPLDNSLKTVNIYQLSSYKTSQDMVNKEGGNYWYYGGEYDATYAHTRPANGTSGEKVPVLVDAGTIIGSATVQRTTSNAKDAAYAIIVSWDKGDLDFYAMREFLQGTATCSNDAIGGLVVPLPGAVLLLGAGLVRLAAYARRRQEG